MWAMACPAASGPSEHIRFGDCVRVLGLPLQNRSGGLNNRNNFVTVTKVRSPRSRCRSVGVLRFLLGLQMAVFSQCPESVCAALVFLHVSKFPLFKGAPPHTGFGSPLRASF